MAGRSHRLQIGLSEYQSQECVAPPCPLRSLARDVAAERQQKVCGCLEATEHCWGMLPPWIHQPHLACLSFLDTSWSNRRTIRKGIKFVSSDEKYHRLGQLNVCANGMQLQNCDMSDLNTHTHTQTHIMHTPQTRTRAPTCEKCRTKISAKIYFSKMLIPTWEHPLKFLRRVAPDSFLFLIFH